MRNQKMNPKEYEPLVDTLADILEQRDKTFEDFSNSGERRMVEYTNKNGSTNRVKNPLIIMWDDFNKTALSYWRELGLTPSSYKKMTGDKPTQGKAACGLAEVLAKLEE